ncbi:KAP family P-loop NTPase fold protein [Rahnella selenatireducens]|uniref:KAP family P-loop NTPase fold protein n=1 Tax=Rahnella selenatireducens TaxID=3389797 RepID=UPI0039681ACE
MSLNWDWSAEVEYLNEKLPPDNLDRAKYAKFLYEVAARRGETSNLVININAEWGAGKTHFTRRLAQTIKDKHPTVYVDAWKQDFSDEPLLAIFSSISDQLGDQSDKFITLLKKTEKKVGVLLRGIAPAVIQGIVKKTTGIDDLSEIAKSATENLIDTHKEKSAVIEDIRKDLAEWVRFIKQKDAMNKDLPIFIFIDELDRCRPNYAINLLEIVKHIFNVKGLVFFISTDTDQLQHSIKVIYGQDFDAQQYLGRFFDRRYILTVPKTKGLLASRAVGELKVNYQKTTKNITPQPINFHYFIIICSDILDAFRVNLRNSIKYFDRVSDIILVEDKKFDPFLLMILMYFFDKENTLYKKIKYTETFDTKIIKDALTRDELKSSLYSEINIKSDLSREKTDVSMIHFFDDHDFLRKAPNPFSNEEVCVNVIDYITSSIEIVKMEKATSFVNNMGNSVELTWGDGGVSRDMNIDSLLKMSWNINKTRSIELKFHEYFDLVELSTTFD